jgi:hypothetical protein
MFSNFTMLSMFSQSLDKHAEQAEHAEHVEHAEHAEHADMTQFQCWCAHTWSWYKWCVTTDLPWSDAIRIQSWNEPHWTILKITRIYFNKDNVLFNNWAVCHWCRYLPKDKLLEPFQDALSQNVEFWVCPHVRHEMKILHVRQPHSSVKQWGTHTCKTTPHTNCLAKLLCAAESCQSVNSMSNLSTVTLFYYVCGDCCQELAVVTCCSWFDLLGPHNTGIHKIGEQRLTRISLGGAWLLSPWTKLMARASRRAVTSVGVWHMGSKLKQSCDIARGLTYGVHLWVDHFVASSLECWKDSRRLLIGL